MKNTRTLISSSLVSLIIIMLGMFVLCMSQSPRISFDEPLVEGGGVASDSVNNDDQDLMNMLNESGDDPALAENSVDSVSSDDDFLSLLEEKDQGTPSTEPSSEPASEPSSDSGDEGMDEILKLLEFDENTKTPDQNNPPASDDLDELLAADTGEPGEQPVESKSSQQSTSVDELSKEVGHLESLLADKTSQADNLQTELKQYDQKINEYQRTSPPRSSDRASVQPVSNNRTSSSVESSYNYESNAGGGYISGDYEGSYNAALDLYRNKDYQQAIATFFQLLQQNPGHQLADNCQYWLGECRYAQGKFYQAIVEFNKVFAHDSPDKQDDAQLMLGLAYLKLGEMNSARNEFDWLVSCYNSSEYVSTANRYLGQF